MKQNNGLRGILLPEITMSFQDWVNLPDHPLQRDTERHARKSRKKHHEGNHPRHAKVDAVRIGPAGVLHKADGHTRTFLWKVGHLTPPPQVLVTIYEAVDLEDFDHYYTLFDNPDAGETSNDVIHGVLKAEGLFLRTPRLSEGGIRTALEAAWGLGPIKKWGRHQIRAKIAEWRRELLLMDSIYDPEAKPAKGFHKHNNAMLAAALLSFRRFGDDPKVLKFWGDVTADLGTKQGRTMDPVEAVQEIGKRAYSGGAGIIEPVERYLSAVVMYRKGGVYNQLPGRTDIHRFRKEAEVAAARR